MKDREHLTVFVGGASSRGTVAIVARLSWTIGNILQYLHDRDHIGHPEQEGHLLYNDSLYRRPLSKESTIEQLRLGDLAFLQYRYRVRGGSTRYPPGFRVDYRRRQEENERERLRQEGLDELGQPITRSIIGLGSQDDESTPMDVDPPDPSPMDFDPQPCPSTSFSQNTHIASNSNPEESYALREIIDIKRLILENTAIFSLEQRLVFTREPRNSGSFVHFEGIDRPHPNTGPYALQQRVTSNQEFLRYERWLHSMLANICNLAPSSNAQVILEAEFAQEAVMKELDRIEIIKEIEWERQRQDIVATGTAPVIDNRRYFSRSYKSWSNTVLVAHIVTVTMHLLFNLPRRATMVLIAGLRSMSRVSMTEIRPNVLQDDVKQILYNIPVDPRTMVSNLDLDPVTRPTVSCPSCFTLYPYKSAPSTCTHQATLSSEVCCSPLYHSRIIKGKDYNTPIRTYLHQEMQAWVGRLLSRPELEDLMDTPRNSDSLPETMCDIWDAPALYSIPDPIDQGASFVVPPPAAPRSAPEGRYIFSLSMDGFNPYQAKEAKQTVTVTAIYMICLSLPPHLRFLSENMYLVGIIPGPNKPSQEQINSALGLLVDDLLVFYNSGVQYLRTAKYSQGRLVRCALGPVVCDLPAARQAAGFAAFNHKLFCSCCFLTSDSVENTDIGAWVPRIGREQKKRAEEWLAAPSERERKKIYDTHGIRWSELHRLPYWDPVLFTVGESAHIHYLGECQNHVRHIWGMDPEADDGDGQYVPQRTTFAEPLEDAMTEGWYHLNRRDEANLLGCTSGVLWHMCLKIDLRRSRSHKKPLIRELLAWRDGPAFVLPKEVEARLQRYTPRRSTNPDSQVEMPTQEELARAEASMAKGTTVATLANRRTNILQALCCSRSLSTEGSKQVLAKRLIAWRDAQPAGVMSQLAAAVVAGTRAAKQKTSATVLGRATLAAVNEDMAKTILPSWINPAPRNAGTKQRGKLSADQWRTLCVIHLPITLIRLWTPTEEESWSGDNEDEDDEDGHHDNGDSQRQKRTRQKHMLDNFMDLVTAIEIAGMLSITPDHIEAYRTSILRYLSTLKTLYKEAAIVPNHHLAVHFADKFFPNFGPLHPIRAFHTERNNFMLQMENTNMKFGELELTYMNHTCRAANLEYLIRDDEVRDATQELVDAYRKVSLEDRRGTRMREAFTEMRRGILVEKGTVEGILEDGRFDRLCQLLGETPRSLDPGLSARRVVYLSQLSVEGVSYRATKDSHKDSNIVFTTGEPPCERAGQIETLFRHSRLEGRRREVSTESFLIVRPYAELCEEDRKRDPYRQYRWAGGRLCYDRLEVDFLMIRSSQVLSHFAKTPMKFENMRDQCIHVLPLNRMVHIADISSGPSAEAEAQAM